MAERFQTLPAAATSGMSNWRKRGILRGDALAIEHIHSFLVHPEKHAETAPQPGGVSVGTRGEVFQLLQSIYSAAQYECETEISFRPNDDGSQSNPCRDLIVDYVNRPSLPNGRKIASRLSSVTDRRSGLGLFFLIVGKEGRNHQLVMSRFPTKSAISADENEDTLTVSYLERVFLKSYSSYKAAIFRAASIVGNSLSVGYVVDRQLGNRFGEYSNYWIVDFLLSAQTVTAAAGTNRFARAIRGATNRADNPQVRQELVAAATLATGLRGQRVSVNDISSRYGLSEAAQQAIRTELRSPGVAEEVFEFDADEYETIVAYRAVDLDNGATMIAPSSEFDQIFQHEPAASDGSTRFTTEGVVITERIKRIK